MLILRHVNVKNTNTLYLLHISNLTSFPQTEVTEEITQSTHWVACGILPLGKKNIQPFPVVLTHPNGAPPCRGGVA